MTGQRTAPEVEGVGGTPSTIEGAGETPQVLKIEEIRKIADKMIEKDMLSVKVEVENYMAEATSYSGLTVITIKSTSRKLLDVTVVGDTVYIDTMVPDKIDKIKKFIELLQRVVENA